MKWSSCSSFCLKQTYVATFLPPPLFSESNTVFQLRLFICFNLFRGLVVEIYVDAPFFKLLVIHPHITGLWLFFFLQATAILQLPPISSISFISDLSSISATCRRKLEKPQRQEHNIKPHTLSLHLTFLKNLLHSLQAVVPTVAPFY